MRKFSLFILLASSAIPAFAAPGDGNREGRRSQAERSAERPQRAERAERREAREQAPREVRVERQQSLGAAVRERYQRQQVQQQAGSVQQQVQQQRRQGNERFQQYRGTRQQAQGESVEQYRQRQLQNQQAQGGALVPREGRYRSFPNTRPQIGQVGPVRTDVRTAHRYDRNNRNRWTNQWRNDNRYDWRRYRDRNRTIFRIGFYSDPFGYDYRRFNIGSFLYPNYYQSNYWINDPWQYRLPPAYGPYRWVRYHNDAVLIDTYTGEVEDVIYGFFW